jgi:hypothetical protein
MRPLRPVLANEAVLEIGPNAGEALSAMKGDAAVRAAHLPAVVG